MADRGHADGDQVVGRQLRQYFAIDIVVAECRRVLFEIAAGQWARQFGRRCAVPKAKFKGVELVRSLDEGRRLLRALHIYVFENE